MHHMLGCLSALSAHTPMSLYMTLRHKHVPVSSVVGGVRAWCVDQYGNAPSGSGTSGRPDGAGGGGGGGSTVGGGGGGTGVSSVVPDSSGDRCHYWAKGTGFGTGSTMQSWDVEQAIIRQRVQEEHIVWLLRSLHNFIKPGEIVAVATSDSSSVTNTLPLVPDSSEQSRSIPQSGANDVRISQSGATEVGKDTKLDLTSDAVSCALFSELFTLISNTQFMDKIASHLSNDSGAYYGV